MIIDLERRWLMRGKCREPGINPEVFFPDHGPHAIDDPGKRLQAAWDAAKLICKTCPVIDDCARDSLGEPDGVWGGLDPAQRKSMRMAYGHRVRRLEGRAKVAYAKLAWELRQAMPTRDVARRIGVGVGTAEYLRKWYQDYLDAPREERARLRAMSGLRVEEVARGATTPDRGQGAGPGGDQTPQLLDAG